jgi:hypothetical protein
MSAQNIRNGIVTDKKTRRRQSAWNEWRTEAINQATPCFGYLFLLLRKKAMFGYPPIIKVKATIL